MIMPRCITTPPSLMACWSCSLLHVSFVSGISVSSNEGRSNGEELACRRTCEYPNRQPLPLHFNCTPGVNGPYTRTNVSLERRRGRDRIGEGPHRKYGVRLKL